MRVINLNPDSNIGASAWCLEIDGHRLLMDAGTHPKREGYPSMPLYRLVSDQDIDAVAITHCHHDHVGSLPIAMRYFRKAHVLLTELSYFIVERVLHNSVNVMTRQRDELGIKEYPLFTHDEVDEIAPVFQGFKYNREIEWASFPKTRTGLVSPTLEFFDAGHALGSAGIMVRGSKETLFYTGDVSFHDQTILRAARFQDIKADVLIMETTRGNRPLPPGFTREKEIERLTQAIDRVLARNGCVLIPSFALGRTQEILAMLALLMREGRMPKQPVYIGGLGRVFTEIYDLESHRTHRQHSYLQLHEALQLIVPEKNHAETTRLVGPKIFVLTAGMLSENTPAHEIAMRMAGDERHAVFFVGYTDPGTPGGRFKASQRGVPFHYSDTAGELTRYCEMDDFDLTAHAQREDLINFVGQVEPHTVLLGHGEEESRRWVEDQIRTRYPKIKVIQPQPGLSVEV